MIFFIRQFLSHLKNWHRGVELSEKINTVVRKKEENGLV